MSKPDAATIEALKGYCASVKFSEFREQTRAVVPAADVYDVLRRLKDERGFDFLDDITCVDYLYYRDATDRFGLVYILTSTVTNEQLIVRTFLNEPNLVIPSVTSLWEGANW